jgi:omega-amidase
MWNCPYSNDSFPVYAEDVDGGKSESASALSAAAAANNVTLVGGSIPEKCGDKLFNTCLVFGREGQILGRHRKVMHSRYHFPVINNHCQHYMTLHDFPIHGGHMP